MEIIEVSFDKKDGIYGITFYIYYMLITYLYGVLIFRTDITKIIGNNFTMSLVYGIISILPIFIILVIRKQSIRSIGFKTDNLVKIIIIGLLGSIPISILNMIGPISSGMTINPNLSVLLGNFIYYFACIALPEELAFRGFIQTRMSGLIKNKWVCIIVVGILFGTIHIPFQMLRVNMPFVDFIKHDIVHLIITSLLHMYFVYIYKKGNIVSSTIAHAIINFSNSMFI